MKKFITITAIVIISVINANAQTVKPKIQIVSGSQVVCAGGNTIILTTAKIAYLKSLNNEAITTALNTHANIKYTSTADLIISVLSVPTKKAQADTLVAKN